MRVAICGGGVIGAATAFFLSRRGASVTIVERVEPAAAASGRAGGFLALDWCAGTPLDALSRRSFGLHAELAAEFGEQTLYHTLTTYQGLAVADGRMRWPERNRLAWTSDHVAVAGQIGTPETTASVHPRLFTQTLLQAAQQLGAELRIANVSGLRRTPDGSRVTGIETDRGPVEADAVVIALGPWSTLAAAWLDLPPVFADKGHSLVFNTATDIPAEAVFLEYHEQGGATLTPEVFPRPDGTTYVSAISRRTVLPSHPAHVVAEPGAFERLTELCARLSPALTPDRVIARQACCRPSTGDGLPLIGAVPGAAGAYVATGHSVWGILNAPATGEAMAELILDGAASSADLHPFDPARLRPLDTAAIGRLIS